MYDNIMIDIETLDTSETAMIVSIGAIKFNLPPGDDTGEEFYQVCDLQSQVENPNAQRTVAIETFTWWTQQSDEARRVFVTNYSELAPLRDSLSNLALFCEDVKTVWANDPTFDCAILRNACAQFDVTLPFKFYQERSVRTMRHVARMLDIKYDDINRESSEVAHNALSDAKMQAHEICYILSNLQKIKR